MGNAQPKLPPEQDLASSHVWSRFKVHKCLGSGGMGHVYLAQDSQLHRLVAIKTVRQDLCANKQVLKRIERECLLHAKVGPHPHIVTLFDKVEEDGRLNLVMEYVKGKTLEDKLVQLTKKRDLLPLKEAITIAVQIAGALSRVHACGVVHRDIKPANIMLTTDDAGAFCAKLMDFGIARCHDPAISITTLTHTEGRGPGTPLYMAPEQIDSTTFGKVTPATDVYAMGAMLYQLLAGRPPFLGSLTEVLSGHLNKPVPPLVQPGGGKAPCALAAIVERALSKKPADRFQSAQELSAALSDFLATVDTWSAKTLLDLDAPKKKRRKKPAPKPKAQRAKQPSKAGDKKRRLSAGSRSLLATLGVLVFITGAMVWGGWQYLDANAAPLETPAEPPGIPAVAIETEPVDLTRTPAPAPAPAGDSEDVPLPSSEDLMAAASTVESGPATVEPAVERPTTYTVQAGDSLYGIARRFEVDAEELARWNHLARPDAIRAGQTLRLTPPSGAGGHVIRPVAAEQSGGLLRGVVRSLRRR